MMSIGGLQKTTLIDYPGKIAATIFVSGCNFFCGWCYSAELVVPEKIKNHPQISEKEIFEFLETKKGLLDGVVICGGEPTMQDDLPDFIQKIKKMGFAVKLDTNGSNPKMLEDLIDEKLINYVAMDIKAPPNFQFPISNFQFRNRIPDYEKEIQRSVEILKLGKVPYEFRTTVVPTIYKKQDFIDIAKWIGGENVKYYLQRFRPEKTIDPVFEKIKSFPDEWMEDVRKQIASYFKVCEIRG